MRKFIVTIEGKQYEVGVEEVGGSTSATSVKIQAPVTTPVVSAPAVTSGTKMEAPMPGMIKAYKVSEGATVKKGDVILILVCDGVVSFKAQVGSNVNTGDVMAVIG